MKKYNTYGIHLLFLLLFQLLLSYTSYCQYDPDGYKKLNITKEEYAQSLIHTLEKRNRLLQPFSRPEQDCQNAIPVCQQSYQQQVSYSGIGQSQDVGNNTCLSGGETNSVWYIFTVIASGTFGFTIETTVDYDFALYNLSNTTCDQLINQTPVRCNFSGQNGETGLTPNNPQAGNLSYNASQARFMPGLNVTAGQTFVLMVNNWSANATGYRLTFNGTSSIFDNVPPTIVNIVPPNCPTTTNKTITVQLSEPILCSTVDNQDFTVTTANGTVVPATVTCGTGSFSQTLIVSFSSPLTDNGQYTLNYVGPVITDQCQNQMVLTNVPFNLTHRPQSGFTASRNSLCTQETATLTFNGQAGPNATYNWNFGSDATANPGGTVLGPHTVSWNTPGVKSLQLTVIEGGCTSTVANQSVTVNRQPTSQFNATANVCTGQNATAVFNGTALANATYNWNFAGGTANPGGSVLGPHTISWATPGVKTLTLQVVENGCNSSVTSTLVTVNSIPAPQLSAAPNPVCTNQNSTITVNGITGNATLVWNCGGCQGMAPTTLGPHSLSWATPGVKSITLQAIQNGCSSAVVNQLVTVNALPTSNFTANPTSICQNANTTFTFSGNAPAGSNFSWNCQGCSSFGAPPNGAGPHSVSWATPGNKTITLQIIASGCSSAVTTQTVMVNPTPTSLFSTDGNTICLNQNITFTYNGNASPQASYQWSFGAEGNPSQANTMGPHTVTWSQPGTYNATLRVIENGCSSTVTTLPINVNRIPASTFTTSRNAICINQNTQISYTGGSTNNATFLWNCDGCSQAANLNSGGPFTLTWATTGVKTITLQLTENNCNSPVSSGVVTVNALPDPPSAPEVARCNAGVLFFTATMGGIPGTQILLYTRPAGGTPIATAFNAPYTLQTTAIATTTTFYTESIHSATGCTSARAEAIARIHPNPAPPTADTVARCSNGTVEFTVIPSALGDIVRLYTSPSAAVAFATVTNAPYLITSPAITTSATYYLQSENSVTGCISSTRNSAVAVVHPNPGAPLANPVTRCGQGKLTFTAIMGDPTGSRIQLFENATGGTPIATAATLPYLLTTPTLSASASYFIESQNTRTGCISPRVQVQAIVNPIYAVPLMPDDSLCTPGQITFKSIDGSAYPPQIEVQLLNRNNIVIDFSNTPPYSLTTPFLSSTTTFFLRTVDNITGCISESVPIKAILNSIPPAPIIAGNTPICRKENLIFNVTGSGPDVTYHFTGPAGANVPAPGPGPVFDIPSVQFSDSGIYTVIAIRNTCVSPPSSIKIAVKDLPLTPNATFYNIFQEYVPLCEEKELNLAVLNYPSFPEGVGFLWTGPAGFQSYPHPFPGVPSVTKAHEGWYKVFAVANGCTSDAGSVYVPINRKPLKPIVTQNTPLCVGDSLIRLTASEVEDGYRYLWRGPANFNQEGRFVSRQAAIAHSGVYTLTVVSDSGCISDPVTANVTVVNPPYDIRPIYNTPLCQGQTLVLGLSVEYPGFEYVWSGPNGFQVTSTSAKVSIPDVQPSQAGLYQVVAYANHCASPVGAVRVQVIPEPKISLIASTTQYCEGQDLRLKILNPNPNYQYTWTGPNQFSLETGSDSIFKRNLNSLDAGVYSVTAIDRGCTSQIQTVDIAVTPNPLSPNVLINGNICIGNSVELIAQGPAGASFFWRGPQNFQAAGETVYRSFSSVQEGGSYSVSAVINGCTSTPKLFNLIVPPQPSTPTITSNSPVCFGNTVTLSASNTPGASYIWNGPDGFVATGIAINRVITSTLQEGLYTVTTLIDGCRSNAAVTRVSAWPLPQKPSVFSNSPVCTRGNLILTAISTTSNVTYHWSGPNSFSTSTTNFDIIIPNATPVNSGIYTVWAEANGCKSATNNINAQVNGIPIQPAIRSNAPICEGQTLRLTATAASNVTVHWFGPNGFYHSGLNGVKVNATSLDAGVYSAVTIQNGCTSTTSSLLVTVSPFPSTPVASNNGPVCAGNIAIFSVNEPLQGVTYLWTGPNSFSAAGSQVSRNITGLQDQGVYSVVAIVNGCTSGAAISNLTVNEINAILSPLSNAPLCEGQALNLDANIIHGATYRWLGPNGFSSTQRMPTLANITTNQAGAYTLTAQVGACQLEPAQVEVTVWQRPEQPTLAVQQSTYCEGQDITLSVRNTPNIRFAWTGPDGFNSSSASPLIPSATTAATGSYQVVAISNGVCSSNVTSVYINVVSAPQAPVASVSGIACTGQGVQLMASTIPGASYNWVGPNGFTSNQQNPLLTNLQTIQSGFYDVVARIGNCVSRASRIEVSVKPTPILGQAQANTPLCQGQTLHLSGGAPQNGVSYTWSGPDNFSSTILNPSRGNITTTQAGTYTLIATANGCVSAPSLISVVVNPTPQITTAQSNAPLCAGDDLRLTADFISGAIYAWTGPNGFSSPQFSPVLYNTRIQQAGVYSLVVSMGNCSTPVITLPVAINNRPAKPSVSYNGPICEGQTLQLTASFVPGASYLWNGPDGYSSTSPNTSLIAQRSGIYNVVSYIAGCTSEASNVNVTVSPAPVGLNITQNTPVCNGQPLFLNATEYPGAVYSWNGPNGFNATTSTISFERATSLQSGRYNLVARIGNCSSSVVSTLVQVLNTPLAPTVGNNGPVCLGGVLQLSASLQNNVSYIWRGPGGFSSSLQNPTIQNITPNAEGEYSLTLVQNGCSSQTVTTYVALQRFASNLEAQNNGPICIGNNLELSTSAPLGTNLLWKGPANFISNAPNPIIPKATAENAGVYTLVAIIGNCTSNAVFTTAEIYEAPIIQNAGSNAPVCAGETLLFSASFLPGASYIWAGPGGFIAQEMQPQISTITTDKAGEYSVVVIIGQCTSEVKTVSVNVLRAPGAITAGVASRSPICEGQNIQLTASLTGEAQYRWSGPNNFNASTQNPTLNNVTTNASGEYSVVAISSGCTSEVAKVSVHVNRGPSALAASYNGPLCVGQVLQLNATEIPDAEYLWSGPQGFKAITRSPSVNNINTFHSGVYSVIANIGECFSRVESISVVVNPSPGNITATNNGPVCEGGALSLSATLVPGATYTWSGPAGFSATGANPSLLQVSSLGTGVYSVIAQIGGCASPVATTTALVKPTPSGINAGSNSPLCNGQTLSLNATLFPGASYLWQGPGGYFASGATPTLEDVSVANNGVYSVTAILNGCTSGVATTEIRITPPPSGILNSGKQTICAGSSANLQFTLSGIGPWQIGVQFNNTPVTYINFGQENQAGPQTFAYAVSQPGIYTLAAITDKTGCIGSTNGSVAVQTQNCITCNAPVLSNLQIIENSTVKINWENTGAICYIVAYGPISADPSTWVEQLTPGNLNSFTVSNLPPGQNYGFRVKGNCELCSRTSGRRSDWSSIQGAQIPNARQSSIVDKTEASVLTVYPNPAKNALYLALSTSLPGGGRLRIYNTQGQLFLERQIEAKETSGSIQLDIEHFPAGVYLLEWQGENQVAQNTKFIKE